MIASGSRKPRVYVVVLNWNRYEHTRKCIESLQGSQYPNLKLIIVDNASADKSGGRLEAIFPQCQFIFNDKNLGFARGCNVGIRAALQDEKCAYVLLINNDATLAPHGLEKAIEMAEADNKIGLVGGKILQSPECKLIWYAGGRIIRWRGQAVTRGYGEIDNGQYDRPCNVGFVTAGLMLITRAVLENVGLLPEEYFFGVEEWDYSLTVRQNGYRLFYVPGFVAYHEGDGSHWNYDPKFVYNYYRNKLIFQEKFLPRGLFPLWKKVLSYYGKHFARRARKQLIKKYAYDRIQKVPLDDLDFALCKATEDHGQNMLSEQTLLSFEDVLKRRASP